MPTPILILLGPQHQGVKAVPAKSLYIGVVYEPTGFFNTVLQIVVTLVLNKTTAELLDTACLYAGLLIKLIT